MQLGAARFDRAPFDVFDGASRAALLDETFGRYAALTEAPGSAALLSTQTNAPVLTRHGMGRGTLMLAGLDLSPASTNFAKTPWLVMLLHESLKLLQPSPTPSPRVLPGQALPLSFQNAARAIGPGGAALQTAPQTQTQAQPPVANQPGLHRLENEAGEAIGQCWVHFPPSESELTPAEPFDVKRAASNDRAGDDRSPSTQTTADAPQSNTVSNAGEANASRPLWPEVAAAALVLLAVEAIIAGYRGRPAPASGEARA
jgi:hypothetical protein